MAQKAGGFIKCQNARKAANLAQFMASSAADRPSQPDLSAPTRFADAQVEAIHAEWAARFSDEWINHAANIGSSNSIIQHTEFINTRLPYAQCAFLASDSIINNAISKIANEMLRKGGEIGGVSTELQNALTARLNELKFWDKIHKAITTALTYGGAFVFIDTNTDSEGLRAPLYQSIETARVNRITSLKIVEPYLCGAIKVNASNPLNSDYMKPSEWFVSGGGVVHNSRLERVVLFETPDMIKPLYNYLGISLCQFMQNYVMSADVARQALSDIFLRFRTIIIKSDLPKINPAEAKARMQFINQQRNNAGTLLLTKEEEYVEAITSLSGLDKIVAQMQENIAVSARMPAVKLLGLTPSGFNATGDFDLKSYYDEIASLQNAILKPLVECFLRLFALELGADEHPTFEFAVLGEENRLNNAQISSTEAQTLGALIQNGVITQEQAFEYLQSKDILDSSLDYEPTEADFGALNSEVGAEGGADFGTEA